MRISTLKSSNFFFFDYLAIFLCCIFIFISPSANASTNGITVNARAYSEQNVRITWKMTKKYASQMKRACLQRKISDTYFTLTCFSSKWRSGMVLDSAAGESHIQYRFLIRKKRGAESIKTRVRIDSTESKTEVLPEPNKNNPTSTHTYYTAPQSKCPIGFAESVIQLINSERVSRGVAPLMVNTLLTYAADVHSQSNASAQTLTHDGWAQEIIDTGFDFASISQNIASTAAEPNGMTAAELAVSLWMGSPSHRDNLLRSDLTMTGVSCAPGANGIIYWAQNFGTPRA